jgi:ribosomal protein S18 acetylase RimI-like enzyme
MCVIALCTRGALDSWSRGRSTAALGAKETAVVLNLTDYSPADAEKVNGIALAAFNQYRDQYSDWEQFAQRIASMSSLSASAEIIVARDEREVAGAVAYVGPHKPKADFFEPQWPILRMLVVAPSFRGFGVGRALTDACISRAVRDKAPLIALHTSPIMEVALGLYQRMGFVFERAAPDIHGVPYGIYVKRLSVGAQQAVGADRHASVLDTGSHGRSTAALGASADVIANERMAILLGRYRVTPRRPRKTWLVQRTCSRSAGGRSGRPRNCGTWP